MSLKRWYYRGGHPNRLARVLDRCTAALYTLGVAPNYLVTLEVRGRCSGRTIALPLVMVTVGGERYLVSMLGEKANWVRNVRALGATSPCVTVVGRRCAWKRLWSTAAHPC